MTLLDRPRRLWALVLAAMLIPFVAPTSASAFSSGPPDGFAGNPPNGEACNVCHFSFDLNSGDGDLQLLGLPTEYVPGGVYNLTVMLEDPGQFRWGFELTVLDDDDSAAEGGVLAVTDAVNTQLSVDFNGTVDYLKQTSDGTYGGVSDGPVSWDFSWTAPASTVGPVSFYVAGNAANGDGSFINDYIYTRAYTVSPESATPTRETTWGRVKSLYDR